MFRTQNRETINSLILEKCCCVLQDHYDDKLDKIVFHTTPDLQDQDQDRSVQDQDQDRFFGLRPVLSDRRSQTTLLVHTALGLVNPKLCRVSMLLITTSRPRLLGL